MFNWANITTYEFALSVEDHTIVSIRVAYIEVVVLSNVQLGQYYSYEFALTVEDHTIVSIRVAYIEVVVLSNVQLGQYYYLRICFDRGRPYNSKYKGSLY